MRSAKTFLRAGLIASLGMPGLASALQAVCAPPLCQQQVIIQDVVRTVQTQPTASDSSKEEAKKVINHVNEEVIEKWPQHGPTGGLIEFETPITPSKKSKSCS
jgi:hypothetical protein